VISQSVVLDTQSGLFPHASESVNLFPVAKLRALVVDDEVGILKLVRAILEPRNYDVTTALGGKKALQICLSGTQPFDFLLTDITMPDMDGRELASELLHRDIRIPILFMSGYASEECKQEIDREADQPLLHKPFSPKELLSAIEAVLQKTAHNPNS